MRKYKNVPQIDFNAFGSNAEPSWDEGIFQIASELSYFAEARYNPVRKSSMQFVYDADGVIEQQAHANDNHRLRPDMTTTSWFDFWVSGTENKATGRLIFRRPRKDRAELLKKYLAHKNYLPQIMQRPHGVDVSKAKNLITLNEFEVPNSVEVMHGRLRGLYISEETHDNSHTYSLILIMHIKGEPCFRTREFEFSVEGSSISEVSNHIDNGSITIIRVQDGLANIGKEKGYIWSGPDVSTYRELTDFEWISKGRRCSKLTAEQKYADGTPKTYNLVRYPAHVEIALSLLYGCP